MELAVACTNGRNALKNPTPELNLHSTRFKYVVNTARWHPNGNRLLLHQLFESEQDPRTKLLKRPMPTVNGRNQSSTRQRAICVFPRARTGNNEPGCPTMPSRMGRF
ncbi:unnamed protein product, partial [Iphiclides podalirius]